jgi:orotidine-5'-phosphate decarboxylase
LLIVAIDAVRELSEKEAIIRLVEKISEYASGLKIGVGVLLKHGLEVIDTVKKVSSRDVIVDLKLADIGDIMVSTLDLIASAGADAVIAHGFIGVKDALDKLVESAHRLGIKVLLVASMSHRGSEEYIDKHFNELLRVAIKIGAHGVVVPATKPQLIKSARSVLGNKHYIYSPGVGVQGAHPGDAICAGADYEIIGRLITTAPDPLNATRTIRSAQLEKVRLCRGYL